jgi:hypothetical protein
MFLDEPLLVDQLANQGIQSIQWSFDDNSTIVLHSGAVFAIGVNGQKEMITSSLGRQWSEMLHGAPGAELRRKVMSRLPLCVRSRQREPARKDVEG